ncbi:MAG: FHA domain-containing protein [Deltaproteobacteria bacterium]|nr:FHA domain-containing protein [Deltaproteobacteria bacterium]MCW5808127.1 FHA domain-containing protein [Deltaproteobacteria bacterium]
MKRFLVREGDHDPLPAIDLAEDVVVIGASTGARIRLPVPAAEHVRIERERWYALADVVVDGMAYAAGESGPLRDGVALDLGAYHVQVTPAPAGAPASPPQRTESLARELVRALLGAGAAPSLTIAKGPNPGTRRDLPPPEAVVVIGRGDEADWVILDEDVSRAHAEVARGWDGITLRDLGSKNGTELGGRRLADGEVAQLRDGDTIDLGDVSLTFHDPAEQHLRAAAPPAPPKPPAEEDARPLSPWPMIAAAGVIGLAIVAIAWVLAS